MRILFVSLFLPHDNAYHAGGRFVFEVIKSLSARHQIELAARFEEGEEALAESVRPYCGNVYLFPYRSCGKRGPLDKLRLALNYISFSRWASGIASSGKYDLVQLEWVESGFFFRKNSTPVVLDAHDVLSKPAERVKTQSKGISRLVQEMRFLAMTGLERRAVKKSDLVLTRSEYDRRYLAARTGCDVKVKVVAHPAPGFSERRFPRGPGSILFLASYKYRTENVRAALYFYKNIFPVIKREVPDARFIAAGYGPTGEMLSAARDDPSFVVPGFVPHLEESYKKAHVFAAPILTGGGIIAKILEAMAAGLPVVTTPYGNEGIEAVSGMDLLVADGPEEFASSVIKLLRDDELAARLGKNGREFTQKNFSLERIMADLDNIYSCLKK